MRVLLTGGAGYLGAELTRALCARGDVSEVVIYDNLSRRNHNLFIGARLPDTPVRVVIADILDTRRLRAELARVDRVVHLAARVSTPFADADYHGLEQVNHWGTAELGYLLEEQPLDGLIYVSSCSVYGDRDHRVGPDDVPQPDSAYALSKLRGERMLERLAGRMPVTVVRCANVYGFSEAMRFDAVVNRFLFDAHFAGRLQVHGSGEQHRAFIHIDHATEALARLVADDAPVGTFNLVERNLSIGEIALAVQAVYPDLEMIFTEQDMRRRDLRVAPDPRLFAGAEGDRAGFEDQLRAFRDHFAFAPRR